MEDRAIAWAERVEHPFTVAGVLASFCATSAANRGDFERSLEIVGRSYSISEENGFPFFRALSEFHRARALGVRGERGALERMLDGLAAMRSTGGIRASSMFSCCVAEECHRVGQAAEGLAALEEASTFAEKHHERYWEPEVYRWRGELLLLGGCDAVAAEPCFQKALEIARAQGARSFELRAAIGLARLWRDQGKRAEARALLQPVYDGFTEGFETQDLKDAKALLEELE